MSAELIAAIIIIGLIGASIPVAIIFDKLERDESEPTKLTDETTEINQITDTHDDELVSEESATEVISEEATLLRQQIQTLEAEINRLEKTVEKLEKRVEELEGVVLINL